MSRALLPSLMLVLGAIGCSAAADRESAVDKSAGEFAPSVANTSAACDTGQDIYLLTYGGELRAFDPTASRARALPALRCATSATPNSMAVDSNGEAWIGYVDGTMYRASPTTGDCRATDFDGPTKGWTRFGMGFIAERGGRDALFVYDNGPPPSQGLVRVDLETEKMTPLGAIEGVGELGLELTGRGDGALFAFATGTPMYIARIDPATLRTEGRIELPIAETASWAFAHWGARFFVFTALKRGHSRVDELVPGRGIKRIVEDLEFEVVGAGVSPCAPTEIR